MIIDRTGNRDSRQVPSARRRFPSPLPHARARTHTHTHTHTHTAESSISRAFVRRPEKRRRPPYLGYRGSRLAARGPDAYVSPGPEARLSHKWACARRHVGARLLSRGPRGRRGTFDFEVAQGHGGAFPSSGPHPRPRPWMSVRRPPNLERKS
jgi:hypothetical protein